MGAKEAKEASLSCIGWDEPKSVGVSKFKPWKEVAKALKGGLKI